MTGCRRNGTIFATLSIGFIRYDSRVAVTASAGSVTDPKRRLVMLYLAIVFFVIALIAYAIGARGVAGMSAGIGKLFLVVFLVLFVVSVIFWGAHGWHTDFRF
jgi:uncharacterized membrane protein YtjA (UPF0391 family)